MKIYKFYRNHCPACDQAERLLKRYKLIYESIDCETEEGEAWVNKLNIRNIPVVYIKYDDGSEKRLINIQEINEWLSKTFK